MKTYTKAALAAAAAILPLSCNKTDIITAEPEAGFTVIEYTPAPGQFINEGFSCNTAAEAAAWAQGRLDEGYFVSLGTFGGYIVVESSEEIINNAGDDFTVSGNAFDGNSEPGIVWVSSDGTAWFRLKGEDSEFTGYSVTYHQTEDGEPGDIIWTDSDGNEGKVTYLPMFHDNSYWPQWISGPEYTLSGTRLECRLHFNEDTNKWDTGTYEAGYVDIPVPGSSGMPSTEPTGFDIANAVDEEGNTANLASIRYIKVQSAVIAPESSPATGEISTEVTGFGY